MEILGFGNLKMFINLRRSCGLGISYFIESGWISSFKWRSSWSWIALGFKDRIEYFKLLRRPSKIIDGCIILTYWLSYCNRRRFKLCLNMGY